MRPANRIDVKGYWDGFRNAVVESCICYETTSANRYPDCTKRGRNRIASGLSFAVSENLAFRKYDSRRSLRSNAPEGCNRVPSTCGMIFWIVESFTLVRIRWSKDEFFHFLAPRLCIRTSLCPRTVDGSRDKNNKKSQYFPYQQTEW